MTPLQILFSENTVVAPDLEMVATRESAGEYVCTANNAVPPTDRHNFKLDVTCELKQRMICSCAA